MKRICLYMLFMIAASAIYGQETQKWFVGLGISPDLCYRSLKNTTGDKMIDRLISERNKTETFKTGVTTGLSLKWQIRRMISIETGLLYSNKGYQLKIDGVSTLQGDSIFFSPSSKMTQRFNYKYVDIPLKLNIALMSEDAFSFYMSGGVTLNMLIEQKNVVIVTSGDGKKEVSTSKGEFGYSNNMLNVSPFMGFGVSYKLGKRMHLQMEPLFRYGILPLYDAAIEGRLWNCGLNAVLYYGL